MKPTQTIPGKITLALLGLIPALLALGPLHAAAANIWWDPVPGTPGPGDGNGTWDLITTNWWDGAQNVAWTNANNDVAVLGFNTASAITNTLASNVTAGGIIFSNTSTGLYTIAASPGMSLALNGSNPAIMLSGPTNGVHLISAAITATNPTVNVQSTLTNANSINLRFTATNNIGTLAVGTPGNTSYTANGIWLDINSPAAGGSAGMNAISANLTNVIVYSNASFRISISGGNSVYSLSPNPQQITISGDGSSGGQNTNNAGAWVVTGNLGGSIAANVVLAGDSTIDFNAGSTSAQTYTLGGVISGTGRLLLVSGNSTAATRRHTCVLSNASTYVGDTIVAGGTTLQLTTGDNRLPTGTVLTLGTTAFGNFIWNSNGVVVLGNTTLPISQTVAGLTTGGFPGTCLVRGGHNSTNSFLTVNNGSDYVYGGNLGGTGIPSINLGLIKSGAGKLSLTGTNQCNGGYTVSAGTLEIGDGATDRPLTGNVTNNAALTLKVASALSYAGVITGSGSLAKANAGALTLSSACNYSGATAVQAGRLNMLSANTGAGAIAVSDGATLGVTVSGTAQLPPATLTLGASTLEFTNVSSTTLAPVNAGTLTVNGSTTINVTGLPYALGNYPLIKYTTLAGAGSFSLGTLPPRITAHLTTNSSTIVLVVDSVYVDIWKGDLSGIWDTSTQNWRTNGVVTAFANGDPVQLDDTAFLFNINITNTSGVSPVSILVTNDLNNYTIVGAPIAGAGSLVKDGNAVLTLASTNTYTGGTLIKKGTLQIGIGGTNGSVVGPITDNGTLAFYRSDSPSITNTLSGAGTINFLGAGGNQTSAYQLASNNAAFTGTMNLTNARVNEWSSTSSTNWLGNPAMINVSSGSAVAVGFSIANQLFNQPIRLAGIGWLEGGGTTSNYFGALRLQSSAAWAGPITLMANARIGVNLAATGTIRGPVDGAYELELWGNSTSGSITNAATTNLTSATRITGPVSIIAGSSSAFSPGPLTMTNGGTLKLMGNSFAFANLSSANAASQIQNGHASTPSTLTVGADGTSTAYYGTAADGGVATLALTKVGAGTLTLTNALTYTGPTTVSNGTLLVNGSLAAGSTVYIAPAGKLGGTGTIGGATTVGGTLSPGASVGTLSFGGALTLAGNVLIEVDKSLTPSNDVVNVAGTLTYGGVLTATNIGATPLVAGDSFPVFPAGGSGTVTVAGSPGSGLAWSFDTASGILSVVSGVNTTPPHLTSSISGGSLNLSWPADHLGWRLETQTNSRSVGLSNNWFTVPGSTSVTATNFPISPAVPTIFYRLVYP
jgi:autotransporter-associated beta strand protein